MACAQRLGVSALDATEGGAYVAWIGGARPFVNRAFAALLAADVPAFTPLLAKLDEPSAAGDTHGN